MTEFTTKVKGRLLDLHLYYQSDEHSDVLAEKKPTKDLLEACKIIDEQGKEIVDLRRVLLKVVEVMEEPFQYQLFDTDAENDEFLKEAREALKAKTEPIQPQLIIAYMAANRTSCVFFEDRDDAGWYAGQNGATCGIEVTEINIIPKGALKEK